MVQVFRVLVALSVRMFGRVLLTALLSTPFTVRDVIVLPVAESEAGSSLHVWLLPAGILSTCSSAQKSQVLGGFSQQQRQSRQMNIGDSPHYLSCSAVYVNTLRQSHLSTE